MKIDVVLAVLALLTSLISTGCQSEKNVSKADSSSSQQAPTILSENNVLDSSISYSSSFISDYKSYMDTVEQYRQTQLTTTEHDLFLDKPEGTLNNVLADMLRWHGSRIRGNQVDVGFIPFHMIQDTLSSGPIRIRDIYRIIPRDREMVLYVVNGRVLRRITEVIAAEGGGAISGLRMTVDHRKIQDILVGSQPLMDENWYSFMAPDGIFCLDEWGQVTGLRITDISCNSSLAFDRRATSSDIGGFVRTRIPVTLELRDIIIQYMSNQKGLNEYRDNRIRSLK